MRKREAEVKLIVRGESYATCRFDEISILLAELADDDSVESVTIEFIK